MFDTAEFIFENLPFEEALKFIRSRIPMTEAEFYRLAQDAKIRAFSVSGMARLDALKNIKDSLGDAIVKGMSLADWKKDAEFILKRWDIAGARAETIYRTNLQTSYQVGRYEQMTDPDVMEMRPYWMYVAVMDQATRPEHAAMHGKVFPADDPIWDEWYPPNGFNCRCTVHTLSGSEMEREGLKPGKGSEIRVRPDEGWDFNPGKAGLVKLSS
jgi:SPP1 gp7 family putative phage head morphogenesis protein